MIMPPRSGRGCNGRSDRLPGIVFAVGRVLPAVAGDGVGMGEVMEYQVNEEFESNGKRFQCVLGECDVCAFRLPEIVGEQEYYVCQAMSMVCEKELRADHTDVRFVEVSK